MRIDKGQSQIAITASGPIGRDKITLDQEGNIKHASDITKNKFSGWDLLEPGTAGREDKFVSSHHLCRGFEQKISLFVCSNICLFARSPPLRHK